jgi:ammonia channel protein AmtB
MMYPTKFARVLVTLLCVFLVFFMTAELAHSHAGSLRDNAPVHCQLCATAHVAVASQPSWLTGYVLHLIGEVTIGETSRGSRAVVQTAFIRPPPVNSSLA